MMKKGLVFGVALTFLTEASVASRIDESSSSTLKMVYEGIKSSSSIVGHFFSSMVPERAPEDFRKFREMGFSGIAKHIGTSIKEHPFEAALFPVSIVLGGTSLGETYPLLSLATGTAYSIKNAFNVFPLIQKIDGQSFLGKGIKFLSYGGVLYLAASVPMAQAMQLNTDICELPGGSYLGSCHNVTSHLYHSSDPNVPESCVLEASCNTIIPSIPPQPNVFYYDRGDIRSLNLSNNNGTLMISGPDPHLSQLKDITCEQLQGSFSDTCIVETSVYKSSDPVLRTTPFCKMEAQCQDTQGRYSDTKNYVYYGYKRSQVEVGDVRVENCDDKLVFRSIGGDSQCSGKSREAIKEMAMREGKRHNSMSSKSTQGKDEL